MTATSICAPRLIAIRGAASRFLYLWLGFRQTGQGAAHVPDDFWRPPRGDASRWGQRKRRVAGVRPPYCSTVAKVRTAHIRAANVRTADIGAADVGAAQVGAASDAQIRTASIRHVGATDC